MKNKEKDVMQCKKLYRIEVLKKKYERQTLINCLDRGCDIQEVYDETGLDILGILEEIKCYRDDSCVD